ncbi:hypothetical protein [Lysinibacillus sphaericus]|uniref:hypothetical protein n=1 Tax=Lysinibacillus sphaericus TaxID=1421 RepID=UPI00248A9F7F|nr:hypothetical protein [Lysinibacillus sphaericus]
MVYLIHASILFYKGISVQYISERLGHADVDTTIRIYTHLIKELREEDERNTMNILAALIFYTLFTHSYLQTRMNTDMIALALRGS